jgi:hypothetical protein
MRNILALVLATACVPALADLVPVGPPEEGGSWEQRFSESGSGDFDLLAVQIASAGDFLKSPAHNDFSDSGWSLAIDGTLTAWAWGDNVDSLEWDVHFAGEISDPLTFDYVVFSDGEIVNAARAAWGARGWTITPFPGGEGAFWLPNPIPVPSAVLLGAVGLMCLRWARRHVT